MDLSGIIFVALAIAWAVYLIPKALRHHDEVGRARSVESFSDRMRVLAHREPVDKSSSRLVVKQKVRVTASVGAPAAAEEASAPKVSDPQPAEVATPTAALVAHRREAARRALQRRRNVLGTILLANVVVAALAAASVVGWVWMSVPAGLLVAWLVTCRVMVKGERAVDAQLLGRGPVRDSSSTADASQEVEDTRDGGPDGPGRGTRADIVVDEDTADVSDVVEAVRNSEGAPQRRTASMSADTSTDRADQADSVGASAPEAPETNGLWDPLPMTLPTYVGKETVARTVRTIDLGQPGAWTSGRTDEDAAIAREADASAKADKEQRAADEARRDAI